MLQTNGALRSTSSPILEEKLTLTAALENRSKLSHVCQRSCHRATSHGSSPNCIAFGKDSVRGIIAICSLAIMSFCCLSYISNPSRNRPSSPGSPPPRTLRSTGVFDSVSVVAAAARLPAPRKPRTKQPRQARNVFFQWDGTFS